MKKTMWILGLTVLFGCINLFAQSTEPIVVKLNMPGAEIQPSMWGLFFEDINRAADGGMYAELVKNRSFEFFEPLMGWELLKEDVSTGVMILNRGQANPANPRYARISIGEGEEPYGLSNNGFRGMGVKEGVEYHFSVLAKQSGESLIAMRIELVNSEGAIIGSASLAPAGADWRSYEVSFISTATDPEAMLNIWFEGEGILDLDMVSLFPGDTWKNRPGGLRADLVQLLADIKPGFLRFPGGCIVEGRELETRYQWKHTIGNVEDRHMIVNRWNTEFKHRLAPDYFQSFGLGFFEYFQLAEDLGAEPIPILNCGMACQFNTAELAPMDELEPYIQDALDLIEFANGSVDTKWGKVRADMGHEAPFKLKMLGIGNEQWGPQYIERFEVFVEAIKELYPEIAIISGTGPSPDGKFFEYAAGELKRLNAEIVDEHYYASPEWFLENADRYDDYDRNGYKIFAGEYAAQSVKTTSPKNQNNWKCALAEAAFMTGLERNADVVHLAAYAPLLAHVDGWQWKPDLIWFDNLTSFGTPNYYVQKLFSTNKGSRVLPITRNEKPLTGQDGLYASAVYDQFSAEIILKLVNTTAHAQPSKIKLEGAGKTAKAGKTIVLKSDDPAAVNSLQQPRLIYPVEGELALGKKSLNATLPPYSVTIIKIESKL